MIEVIAGDCLEALSRLPAESVDSIVTDPPAGISFMGKHWDGDKGGRDQWIAWMQSVASECLRVAKPGAHALVWALPRTSHWTATAWENAGWEVRDRVAHLFGTGFPKSLNVSYAIDDHFFHEWLRAHPEHAVRLRGLKGDARKEVEDELRRAAGLERKVVGSKLGRPGMAKDGSNQRGGFDSAFGGLSTGILPTDVLAPATPEAAQWTGYGTALKPACEDWWLLRKPLSEHTVAANILKYGCGALNIDATRIAFESGDTTASASSVGRGAGYAATVDKRVFGDGMGGVVAEPHALGRFPANLVHDGSPEVLDAFAAFGITTKPNGRPNCRGDTYRQDRDIHGNRSGGTAAYNGGYLDTGSAARFFYSAKASKADRMGTTHPTTKLVSLIEYLCRLVTPPGGTVLDPFAGSGTLVPAARRLGVNAILIEREPEYIADIERRIANDTETVQRKDKPPAPPSAGSPPTLFDAIAVG